MSILLSPLCFLLSAFCFLLFAFYFQLSAFSFLLCTFCFLAFLLSAFPLIFAFSTPAMVPFHIYSPEEEITDALFKEKGLRLFIKRDDMIHPFISGNKWRKLKYNLIKAEKEDKNHLVTFGGVWSNHLLATACAAAKYGFRSTAFVRGEDVKSETLFLCKLFGMELIFTDRQTYRDKPALFKSLFEGDQSAFFIDEGGAGAEAAKGCAELVNELRNDYQHIFCAAGTGTTAGGILKGLSEYRPQTTLHVVPVLKGAAFLKENIRQYEPERDFLFHDVYHFGGYAKTEPALLSFISGFSSSTGILLDPVYTGKMMYAVYDLMKKDYFCEGDKIVVVHTGGLFGLLGMKDNF